MQLSTDDLPKLFTRIDALEEGGDDKISVLPCAETTTEKKDGLKIHSGPISSPLHSARKSMFPETETDTAPQIQVARKNEFYSHQDDLATKEWILQQYQYDNDYYDDDDNDKNKSCSESIDAMSMEHESQKVDSRSVEEIRLEAIEKQIEMDLALLNDDTENYMRSKYEIDDIKKRLKKAQQQAKGLRDRISKKKAREEVQMEKEADLQSGDQSDDEGYYGGTRDLFAKNAVSSNDNMATVASITSRKDINECITSFEIPTGWTGKTPQELLFERCRKRNIPAPTFSKINGTKNGCKVRIQVTSKEEKIIDHSGPFLTVNDAQQYIATLALYRLEPDLSLQTLLPQPFRDLWKSWVEERDSEKRQQRMKEHDDKENSTKELLASIKTLLAKQNLPSINLEENAIEKESPPEDWDDESITSESEMKCEYKSKPRNKSKLSNIGTLMQEAFRKKQLSQRYRTMQELRTSLPINDYRSEILQEIKKNPVTVLCAETGAGKTTQCPQFILEDALESGNGDKISIICTQPRRISAISVAQRVAEEMDEELGRKIGFQVRMEQKMSSETKLMFCTTGVVLKRLQDDPNLAGVTHVVVDECHERQWQIDFLLIALRQMLQTKRADLKVVLMSATLDSDLFCSFFNNAPLLKIPGRTFPVTNYFLEDILEATGHIIEENSRCARVSVEENLSLPISITENGGKSRRISVSFDSDESVQLSEYYENYSLATRR